jgi:hypothetical protein
LLCACNQIFGVGKTRPFDASPVADAQYFDVPADAPFACPLDGSAPRFSRLLHQAIVESCSDYTASLSGDKTTASCYDLTTMFPFGYIGQSAHDATFAPAGLMSDANIQLAEPRLSPEGDELIVRVHPNMAALAAFQINRDAGAGWVSVASLPGPTGPYDEITTPTAGPNRHVLINANSDASLHEWTADDATEQSWTEVLPAYTSGDLGVAYLYAPSLSSDGLRLLYLGALVGSSDPAVLYLSRAHLTDRFPATPTVLEGVPVVGFMYMTNDCARLYFTALGSIFYVQQQ